MSTLWGQPPRGDHTPKQTLWQAVVTVFPNADPWWCGHPSPHGAVVEWLDGHFVVTPTYGGDGPEPYMVGIYPAPDGWNGDEPVCSVDIDSDGHVVELLDWLTDNQPEGTDFWAWVVQWISDNHETIDGLVSHSFPEGNQP